MGRRDCSAISIHGSSVVSDGVHELLQRADGRTPLGDLLPPAALTQRLVEELLSLWDRRLVTLQP